jgi:hypothetical protein
MQDKRIMYCDSYLNTVRTRALCSHKKENQMRILQALLQYLKDEHLNSTLSNYPINIFGHCTLYAMHLNRTIPKIVAYLFACIANLSCTTLI